MAVALSRSGSTGTVAVTLPVADLIAAVQGGSMTAAAARVEAVRRAARELLDAANMVGRSDAEIDADATAATAEAARLKALRPTGNL